MRFASLEFEFDPTIEPNSNTLLSLIVSTYKDTFYASPMCARHGHTVSVHGRDSKIT